MVALCSGILAVASAVAATSVAGATIGPTFGNALAGVDICAGAHPGELDTIILNYTLSAQQHGVLHHFWITGNHGPGEIDEAWVSYYIDGETEPVAQHSKRAHRSSPPLRSWKQS
eukprot:SAG31_NODE_601_length_13643_cov_64.237005_8_plen_115_part_00